MGRRAPARSKRGPEASTSLQEIVDAALALLARDGIKALSMRRLSVELGLGAMTLYSYFATKEELLDHCAARVLGNLGAKRPSGDWRAQLLELLSELHGRLRANPAVADIVNNRVGGLPVMDPFRESVLAALDDAGFDGREMVAIFTSLVAYVSGYTTIYRLRPRDREAVERKRLNHLPADLFPHLRASARDYADHVAPGGFELGLNLLLDGVAARAAKTRSSRRSSRARK